MKKGQGSFEYVLMIAGVVLLVTVAALIVGEQAAKSGDALERNIEHQQTELCYAPEAAERGQTLVASWRFDEGAGTVAKDSSGNENHGTLNGNPQWTDGKLGKAIEFDGVGDYVEVPSSTSLDIDGKSFTISMWVKPNDFANKVLLGKCDTYALRSCFHVVILDSTWLRLGFYMDDLDVIHESSIGEWTHYAFRYDTDINEQTIFVNGVFKGSEPTGGDLDGTDNRVLKIGKLADQTTSVFNGVIDEVRFYSKALSQEEILAEINCKLR
ncbi:MAG: LamG-like jellyroll fold domain-containing protein [Candidatus Micrarchaeia archaeon]